MVVEAESGVARAPVVDGEALLAAEGDLERAIVIEIERRAPRHARDVGRVDAPAWGPIELELMQSPFAVGAGPGGHDNLGLPVTVEIRDARRTRLTEVGDNGIEKRGAVWVEQGHTGAHVEFVVGRLANDEKLAVVVAVGVYECSPCQHTVKTCGPLHCPTRTTQGSAPYQLLLAV